jgi:4-diphosphocytidyl-2-C-methyl-D-erythritol kinase
VSPVAPLIARCPAKINLGLRVLGRRADGYHELDTVFQAIDLWDTIVLRPALDLTLTCDDPRVPSDATNLVHRAASLVRERTGRGAPGAALELRKAIPVEAGLGGGSSDAAGALEICARHWGVDLTPAERLDLACRLGADVPFFLVGGTARGTGRGDRIESLPFVGTLALVLGLPPFGVSTAEAFRALRTVLTLDSNDVSFRPVSDLKWKGPNDFARMGNDLERVVFPRWPALAEFRDDMIARGARHARLSGSGSTVYGVFADEAEATGVARDLESRYAGWRVLVTRSIDAASHVVPPAGR